MLELSQNQFNAPKAKSIAYTMPKQMHPKPNAIFTRTRNISNYISFRVFFACIEIDL